MKELKVIFIIAAILSACSLPKISTTYTSKEHYIIMRFITCGRDTKIIVVKGDKVLHMPIISQETYDIAAKLWDTHPNDNMYIFNNDSDMLLVAHVKC